MRAPPASIRVRVPAEQSRFFHVPGRHGGWYASLLWNYGSGLDVGWAEVAEVLRAPPGAVMLGRRLVGAELAYAERSRRDIETEVHAHLIRDEATRWDRQVTSR